MEVLISVVTGVVSSAFTGLFTYLAMRKKIVADADAKKSEIALQQQLQANDFLLKEREQLFAEYRNLVNASKVMIDDLQDEINLLQEDIRKAQVEYNRLVDRATTCELTIVQLREECARLKAELQELKKNQAQ